MKWMRSFFKRLTDFLGKRKRDTEFAAELESHLRLHIEDNLRAGMTPEAARRDALTKLGGVEQTKRITATAAACRSSRASFKMCASPSARCASHPHSRRS